MSQTSAKTESVGESSPLWRAAKVSAASAAGPAGLAVGSALLAAAACALGALIAPQAMSEGLKSPQTWPALLAGMSAAGALMGTAAAGAVGFHKGFKDEAGDLPARSVKDGLLDAWRTMRAHMIHGPLALGLVAATAGASAVGASPALAASVFGAAGGATASAMAGFVCVPMAAAAVMATLAAVLQPAERAVEVSAAAVGSERGERLRAERVEMELDRQEEAKLNPSPLRALASRLLARRGAASKPQEPSSGGPSL